MAPDRPTGVTVLAILGGRIGSDLVVAPLVLMDLFRADIKAAFGR